MGSAVVVAVVALAGAAIEIHQRCCFAAAAVGAVAAMRIRRTVMWKAAAAVVVDVVQAGMTRRRDHLQLSK